MTVEFGVLGPLAVWSDGETIEVKGAKRRGVLAYLLAHAGEPQPLDRIVDALWGETASSGAEATVQTYVSQLRKVFGAEGPTLALRAGGYVLDLDANALDASRFEAAVAAATAISDDDKRLALLDEALALWRGVPFDEFAGQEWADERARRWTRMHVVAQQLRAAALLDAGRHRDALPTLEQLVAAHPLHEPFWAQLVVARYRCGQQSDALAAVSEARKVLATELGIELGPELVELENKVLRQDHSLDTPARKEAAPRQTSDVEHVGTVVEPLPEGVVTVLMTDIEGSTALWDQHPEQMAKALVRHEDVIADVVQVHDGRLLRSRGEGDSTLSVFARATNAVAAAVALQRRLHNEPWPGGLVLPTRIAVHAGEAQLRNGDYYGGTLNRAARIRGIATGGQVLVSRAVHDVVVDVLGDDLELVGVGEHEFKGLRRSETVYAVQGPGLDTRPPTSGEVVICLPRTSFVGRTRLVDDVVAALRRPGIVTLVGPGGIGKTRLALEAAAQAAQERAFVVELAQVSDSDAVLAEIAATIGVTHADTIEAIAFALGHEPALLVIDNCEHLIDECARVVAELTDTVPTLTMLVTSRLPLELTDEKVLTVEPLPQADARRLLLDRAQRVEAAGERESLNEIVRRVDGIPLALELTAARLRSMSAADLLARLPVLDAAVKRPATERHATMRAALDWSYDLLNEQERALLRRLSVFAGFTLDAAEHVAPGDDVDILDRAHVGDLLDQLVLHSLVVFDPTSGRYRLLEPVRQYAAELLERDGEAGATRERHARYFAHIAERVARSMAAGEQSRTDLDDDEGNLEAALTWADEHDDAMLCRVVTTLGFFWVSTNAEQGVRWTRRAVAHPRDVAPALWASTLVAAGELAQARRPTVSDAAAWLDEAIAIYRHLGRTRALAWALFWRGRLIARSDPLRAKEHLEEALTQFRARDDALGIAWALFFLGAIAEEGGDYELFRSLSGELLDVASTRVPALLGVALAQQAFARWRDGDVDDALGLIAAAEERQRDGDRFNLASVLLDRAWMESQIGSNLRALAALHEALQVGRRVALDHGPLLVTSVMLIQAGNLTDAREILVASGVLDASRMRQLLAPRPRDWVRYIETHLDLTRPPMNRFASVADAIDWSIQWTADQIKERQLTTETPPSGRDGMIASDVSADHSEPPRSPSLVGRADVIARIEETFGHAGLVTLVGPGGIGKTRLLEEACARFADQFERVWRIDLVAARDRAAVESALEDALLPTHDSMTESREMKPQSDLIADIGSHLGDRRALVALDNCEQLLDFLPEIVEALLARATHLTVLATSREPLGARGEVVVPVTPLELPSDDVARDLSRLQQNESVELLLMRARERGADVAVTPETADDIASVCRQLDGIPLALELAAARLQSTSIRDLAARLPRQLEVLAGRGTDARHRTLRNAIDWSYELLQPSQQVLLRRLGIFMGGFTLDAAEEVCSGDAQDPLSSGDGVYLNLAELVSKSLVIFERDRDRYRLLEPIRQFARNHLESSDDFAMLLRRHARWAVKRSRETSLGAMTGEPVAATRFSVELDNLHAALDWLREHDRQTFLRAVAALGYAWFQTDWRRGRATVEAALAIADDAPSGVRAGLLLSRGILEQRDHFSISYTWLEDARALYLAADNALGAAWSQFFLARSYSAIKPDRRRQLDVDAMERFRALKLPFGELACLIDLGYDAYEWGRLDEAKEQLERALALAEEANDKAQYALALGLLGRTNAARGEVGIARRQMSQAIERYRRDGDRWNGQDLLSQAALVEATANHLDDAEALVRESIREALDIDEDFGLREALLVLAVIRLRQGMRHDAALLLAVTRCDYELPGHVLARPNSMLATTLRELTLLLDGDDDTAEREARTLGLFGVARKALL